MFGLGEMNMAQAEIERSLVIRVGVPAVATVTIEETGRMAHLRSEDPGFRVSIQLFKVSDQEFRGKT